MSQAEFAPLYPPRAAVDRRLILDLDVGVDLDMDEGKRGASRRQAFSNDLRAFPQSTSMTKFTSRTT